MGNGGDGISKRVAKRFVAKKTATKTTATKKPKTVQEVVNDLEARVAVRRALIPAVKRPAPIMKQADFPVDVVRQAFEAAGGQCECRRKTCTVKHKGRCPEHFDWDERDTADNPKAWQGHHWRAQSTGGTDKVTNCEILCVPCHISTSSYGRPADK